jgi:hypothetical protein
MPKLDVCQETTANTYQVQDYLVCLMLATSVETFIILRKKYQKNNEITVQPQPQINS